MTLRNRIDRRMARIGRLAIGVASLAAALCCSAPVGAADDAGKAVSSRVTFDRHSFLIDGRRLYLWSGEFHPYRLPSPELWRDIFQRMKAAGFNTASIYFSWGYHSAAPGRYDFSGIRDMDRLLDAARDAGIYVIARPGPYINAEVDSGGFPLWFTRQAVRNRSDDPAYLALADEWLTRIDRIIARHQIDGGRGTVIAYQVENEFYDDSAQARNYMAHLEEKARSDGITVPLVGNHNGTFVTGKGAVDVSGWDHYPQGFDCSSPDRWKPVPDMAQEHGAGQPVFAAEYQGGSFDPWGGPGYPKCARLIDDRFADVFYKSNIAAGATAQNFYMVYGGTSWGWQAIPQNYTSYDYGAAITEGRRFDPKYWAMKRIGYMIAASPPLLSADPATPARLDDPTLVDVARTDAASGTQYHLIRHGDTASMTRSSTHLSLHTADGDYASVPQLPGTAVVVDGRDARLLVAGADLGASRLVYSTSELMTHAAIGDRDVVVLNGRHATPGETVLRFDRRPDVKILSGSVEATWDKGRDLRLNYTHDGLARVLVTGGAKPLLLLLGDDRATAHLWRQDTQTGPVLALGGALVRRATVDGDRLDLTGEAGDDRAIEIFAAHAGGIRWNGKPLVLTPTPTGSVVADLPATQPVTLPTLGSWTMRRGAPEATYAFDDRSWRIADARVTASITKPGSLPVLFADDYGFHVGNTWYRGHFTAKGPAAAAAPTGLRLKVQSGGPAGAFSVWLNGMFLGSVNGNETGDFGFPAAALRRGDNVVSVLTVNMGHEEDYDSKGENRTARGIISAVPLGASGDAISWRIQGRRGGEGATDPVRGPYNEGGLYGEREGWHVGLDGTAGWASVALPADADASPGVAWYRTTFRLDLPHDADHSLGLLIADPPGRHYRATIFVNGWQFGNYISDVGPQHSFPIPNGVLRTNGTNDVTIAVWKTDASAGGLGTVSLVEYQDRPIP